MTKIKLIVGLGNPGLQYSRTRHNAGVWFVDELVKKHSQTWKQDAKFFGHTSRIPFAGADVRVLVPETFMNLSGKSVLAMMQFYNISVEEILVAHDELDLLPGHAKLKLGGSHGGHNGLKDIINKCSNNANFYRLRIGIGHPGQKAQVVNYVLNAPPENERKQIDAVIDEAVSCTDLLFQHDLETAMNRLHAFKI